MELPLFPDGFVASSPVQRAGNRADAAAARDLGGPDARIAVQHLGCMDWLAVVRNQSLEIVSWWSWHVELNQGILMQCRWTDRKRKY